MGVLLDAMALLALGTLRLLRLSAISQGPCQVPRRRHHWMSWRRIQKTFPSTWCQGTHTTTKAKLRPSWLAHTTWLVPSTGCESNLSIQITRQVAIARKKTAHSPCHRPASTMSRQQPQRPTCPSHHPWTAVPAGYAQTNKQTITHESALCLLSPCLCN